MESKAQTGIIGVATMQYNMENQQVPYSIESAIQYSNQPTGWNFAMLQGNRIRIPNLCKPIVNRKLYNTVNTEIAELLGNTQYSMELEHARHSVYWNSSIVECRKTVGGVNFGNNAGNRTPTPHYIERRK